MKDYWKEFLKDVPTSELENEIKQRKSTGEYFKVKRNINPISLSIIGKIDDALKQFGSYTFDDKGPYEVMDIGSIVYALKQKEVEEISTILSQILDNYENKKRSSSLVSTIIGELDESIPDDDFEELLNSDNRFEY